MFHMAPDQLDRYRRAVADDTTGAALEAVAGTLRSEGNELTGHDVLKTAPRGYARDHPRIDLLRGQGTGGLAPMAAGGVARDEEGEGPGGRDPPAGRAPRPLAGRQRGRFDDGTDRPLTSGGRPPSVRMRTPPPIVYALVRD